MLNLETSNQCRIALFVELIHLTKVVLLQFLVSIMRKSLFSYIVTNNLAFL